jgi:hypothetical protein
MFEAVRAGDVGDWHRAGVFHGVAERFRDLTGEPWQDPEERYRLISIDRVRAHLGDYEFQRALAEGRDIRVDDAAGLSFNNIRSA